MCHLFAVLIHLSFHIYRHGARTLIQDRELWLVVEQSRHLKTQLISTVFMAQWGQVGWLCEIHVYMCNKALLVIGPTQFNLLDISKCLRRGPG